MVILIHVQILHLEMEGKSAEHFRGDWEGTYLWMMTDNNHRAFPGQFHVSSC